jgi:ubiquinone/menaquinone biosynthesis C-methylase UbiE
MAQLQSRHAILPTQTHDEFARESFASSMRKFFTEEIFPGNRELYAKHLLPAFGADQGRPPQNRQEVKELMNGTFYYRAGSLLGRASQELLWDVVGESVERQLETLKSKVPKGKTLGSLRVNPDLQMPAYIEAVDIHVMPGNFHTEITADDVYAGALYDRGVHVFSYGGLGEYNHALGEVFASFFKQRFPDRKPKRVLDMGCGCGFSTVPFKLAYPDAEVYGIDTGAPMVRYAHARAESLGVAIHFSQQNAAATDFPDGYFDVVYSALLHHECPRKVIEATLREGYRLLAPGGVMFHDGSKPDPDTDPFQLFLSSWFTNNNNEPFENAAREVDFEGTCIAAGFLPGDIFYGEVEQVYLKGQLPPIPFRGAVKR